MSVLEVATRTLPESIAYLELSDLGRKLLDDDALEAERRNGERLWDEDRVEQALHEYRQFLALMLWYPDAVLVPSEDIDEVWHAHVLNTARYQDDCETIFGSFQHHAPTFGDSEEVQAEQLLGCDETLNLFEEAFGEIPQSYTCHDDRKCGRVSVDPKCGRTTAKCGRAVAKCGRAVAKCGRMDAKCGRTAAKCGRMAAKCGRK
ncbi:MAG: glycine-rich domain-containing protein-like [Planctomycetaceae bacterium]|nr:glycine-rich domain-containing protein-like [Planctomycetaceae bacterium]